jgi:hypothetical protein
LKHIPFLARSPSSSFRTSTFALPPFRRRLFSHSQSLYATAPHKTRLFAACRCKPTPSLRAAWPSCLCQRPYVSKPVSDANCGVLPLARTPSVFIYSVFTVTMGTTALSFAQLRRPAPACNLKLFAFLAKSPSSSPMQPCTRRRFSPPPCATAPLSICSLAACRYKPTPSLRASRPNRYTKSLLLGAII